MQDKPVQYYCKNTCYENIVLGRVDIGQMIGPSTPSELKSGAHWAVSTVPSTPSSSSYLIIPLLNMLLLLGVNQGQVTTGCDSNHSYLSLVSPEPDTLFFSLLLMSLLTSSQVDPLSRLRWISWCFHNWSHTGIQQSLVHLPTLLPRVLIWRDWDDVCAELAFSIQVTTAVIWARAADHSLSS